MECRLEYDLPQKIIAQNLKNFSDLKEKKKRKKW